MKPPELPMIAAPDSMASRLTVYSLPEDIQRELAATLEELTATEPRQDALAVSFEPLSIPEQCEAAEELLQYTQAKHSLLMRLAPELYVAIRKTDTVH